MECERIKEFVNKAGNVEEYKRCCQMEEELVSVRRTINTLKEK